MGILELADAGHGVDRRRDGGRVGSGVIQRVGGRVGGQVNRRALAVAGLAEAFGSLADAHDDGGTRVEGQLAHESPVSIARLRICCSQSATIWRVISPAGLICSKEPTT